MAVNRYRFTLQAWLRSPSFARLPRPAGGLRAEPSDEMDYNGAGGSAKGGQT